ncbi:MAG: Sua5/YciO/YrdC/YwlC family protein, partial [Kovacikia sp.]
VMGPKRRTTGIRVPDHPISKVLLERLGNPIVSISAPLLTDGDPLNENVSKPRYNTTRFELFDCLEKLVDVIVDSGTEPGFQVSTILDLTQEEPIVVRRGLGWEEVVSWLDEAG